MRRAGLILTKKTALLAGFPLQQFFHAEFSSSRRRIEPLNSIRTSGEICQKAKVPCANQPNRLAVLANVFGRAYSSGLPHSPRTTARLISAMTCLLLLGSKT
jgi:hypothetical protein